MSRKFTKKQELVLELLRDAIHTWQISNDVQSPSHYTLVEEEVNERVFDDELEEKDAIPVTEFINNIRTTILKRF